MNELHKQLLDRYKHDSAWLRTLIRYIHDKEHYKDTEKK